MRALAYRTSRLLLVLLIALALAWAALASSSCGGGGGSSAALPSAPTIASITLSPLSATIVETQTQQFTAVAKDSSGSTVSGASFTWFSDNTGVATVDNTGKATAVAVGMADITASSGGVSGKATLTVTTNIKTVTVTPSSATISVGQTQQFSATATSSSGSTLSGKMFTWASSNTSVATVDSTGKATGVAAGTTTISADSEGVTGTATLTITSSLTLTGTVAISPVSGASVGVYSLNPDGSVAALLGAASTNADGSYSLTMNPAPTGPVVVYITGGSYTDEVTGASVNLIGSPQLSAVLPVGTTRAAITPLTEMAASRAFALAAAGTPLATAVSSSNIGIEEQYQLADILGTLPVAANNATAVEGSLTEQRNYGLVLAGIMQEAQSLNVQAIDLAGALAADASDGILDGMDPGTAIVMPTISGGFVQLPPGGGTSLLQVAMNQFIASPKNATKLVAKNIVNQPVQIGPTSSVGFYPDVPVVPAWVSGRSGQVTLGVALAPGSAGGTPPFHCSLAQGSLPPPSWLTLTTDGECVLSGTAPALPADIPEEILPGPFTLAFTDSSTPIINQIEFSYWITVIEPAPSVTPVTPQVTCTATVNGPTETATCSPVPIVAVSGGDPPYDYDGLGTDPPLGLFVDPLSGALGGTGPAALMVPAAGTYTFPVCVVDSFGAEACANVTATVTVTSSGGGLTGTWTGNVTESYAGTSGSQCTQVGTMTWVLTQTGGALNGTVSLTESLTPGDPSDCGPSFGTSTDTVQGSITGTAISLTGSQGETFTATVNGSTITGTGAGVARPGNVPPQFSYTLTKQ